MNQQYIIIDGSYFTFYRYFSIVRWWKNSHPLELDVLENPIENPVFVETFFRTFLETLRDMEKNLKKHDIHILENVKMVVAEDCKRADIWRNEIYDSYKTTRKSSPGFSPFIKRVYDEGWFEKAGISTILYHPHLEADDCIALFIKEKRKCDSTSLYTIIASDKDYLQLVDENTQIIDMQFAKLHEKKSSMGDAKKDLFCKIVMGDPSDNIPSVIDKCGPKTAEKCFESPEYFQQRLSKKEGSRDILERNRRLVDFEYIPAKFQEEFLDLYFVTNYKS
jgi:5'-3' exonuclease